MAKESSAISENVTTLEPQQRNIQKAPIKEMYSE